MTRISLALSALLLVGVQVSAALTTTQAVIQSVGAISINASHDVKVLVDWYQKFGFDLQFSGGVYWGSLKNQAGPPYFSIHSKQPHTPTKNSKSVSLVFRVSDYDSYVSMLDQQGLKAESVESDSTGHFSHYRDPDGNEMTIWGD